MGSFLNIQRQRLKCRCLAFMKLIPGQVQVPNGQTLSCFYHLRTRPKRPVIESLVPF